MQDSALVMAAINASNVKINAVHSQREALKHLQNNIMNKQIITMDGKYKYRNGEPARALCLDANRHLNTVISITQGGVIRSHTVDGFYRSDGIQTDYDLIPDVPLWEGEIWVHKDGRITSTKSWTETELRSWDYKKIKVREVEQCQS